ncbi:hypothetical protein pipiens_007001 [Culex pipiens pipiens]|uniref:Uncharacterized protein n=1 Tax=Culex pipiens pipiens TaxID=38569 RepID=A0ABD1DMH5_CULPP
MCLECLELGFVVHREAEPFDRNTHVKLFKLRSQICEKKSVKTTKSFVSAERDKLKGFYRDRSKRLFLFTTEQ